MPACEKCWSDSAPGEYNALVEKRSKAGNECSPEEQAGPDAYVCPVCKRKTVHQYVPSYCMNCNKYVKP